MSENVNINEEAILDEDVEDAVMRIMTNEPSEPMEVGECVVVFQRPSLPVKYKQRSWSKRRMKEYGIDPNGDSDESYLFQQWGTLNAFISTLYMADKKGKVKLSDKNYTQYEYDSSVDLDYGSVFEKYVMEEIYNKGKNEEIFLVQTFAAFVEWLNSAMVPDGDDIKNS